MIKSVALLIMVTFGNGQTQTAPVTYYDTIQECEYRAFNILKNSYPFQVKATCAPIKGEVPEEVGGV
jgi:hypothetical protein